MLSHYTDEELIEGLRQKKRSCIEYMYKEFYPVIRHYIKLNSGNQHDADDLFQDAIIVLFKRFMIHPFALECSLKTYFMAVCKNLWLQRLERKYRLLYQADLEVHESKGKYSLEEEELRDEDLERQRLFYKNLMLLPYECRRLLQLYCLKISYKEIARLLKYKDEIYVKTRKYSCKNLLRKKILKDPECHQFFNYNGTRNNQRLD